MYKLIYASGYYSVCNKAQMKKRCIKKSCIIATNKSKHSLQQIADNLNKKMPKIRLTTSSISDSSVAVDSNAMLNIETLNMRSESKESTCVLSNNNCEQWNTNQKSDLTLCDNVNDRDNIKGSTCLTKDALSIDGNPNTLVDNCNNVMSDLSQAVSFNAASNIVISNVTSEIKEGTCVLSNNNCEQWNTNQKSDSNFTLCDNVNDRDIKGSTCLTKDALSIDGNPNTLVDGNNLMIDSLLAANSNTTSNVNVENILTSILGEPSDVTQSVQCCDELNSSLTHRNANVIETFRNPKKSPKILLIQNVTNKVTLILLLPILLLCTEKTDNIMNNNIQLNNTYNVTNNINVSSNANKIYVSDNISNGTFVPLAESTFVKNESTSEYEINNNNTHNESKISISSKNNSDDSFHVSDSSKLENKDEDKIENTREHMTSTNKNKTVNSTLHLTASRSSKVAVCDDRNMYVENSDSCKLKLNMCLYFKSNL